MFGVNPVNFEQHFVFSFEQSFGYDLGQDFFGLLQVELKQVENSVETVGVGERRFVESGNSSEKQVEKPPKVEKLGEIKTKPFEGVIDEFFHSVFAQDSAVNAS